MENGLLVAVVNAVRDLTVNRLTAIRTAFLDAAISSRAAASDYTTARAVKLDALDAAISTRASAADYTTARAAKLDLLTALTGGSIIKWIYRSTIQISGSNTTATVAVAGSTGSGGVNPAKSICLHNGASYNGVGAAAGSNDSRIELTSGVLITATRDVSGGNLTIAYIIIEFN